MANLDFTASLNKAEEVDGRLFVSGVASTTSKDLQGDIITANALQEMAKSAVGVPVVTSHNHEFIDEIGKIAEASYSDNKLFVKCELDALDPLAVRTYKKIEKAGKVGFSIGADILKLGKRLDKSARLTVDSVIWKHLALTSKPVNQNTFAIALNKAINEDNDMGLKDKQTTPIDPDAKIAKPDEAPVAPADDKKDAPIAPTDGDGKISIGGDDPVKIGDSLQERTSNVDGTADHGGTMLKAGAMFSAATLGSLKAIHDGGNADTKSKVRAMLGDQAANVLDGQSDDSTAQIGVVNKSLLAELKAEIVKDITLEIAKSRVDTRAIIESHLPDNTRSDFRSQLLKAMQG